MKRQMFLLLVVVISISKAHAGERYVTGGVNLSRFYDVGSQPLSGFSLGFGKEWQHGPRARLKLSVSYSERGAKLEEKVVHPDPGEFVNVYNLSCRIGYLTFPLSYQYYFSQTNTGGSYFMLGVTPLLAIRDKTNRDKLSSWYEPDLPREAAHYFWNVDPGPGYQVDSSTIGILMGAGWRYLRFAVEGHISIDALGDVDTLRAIDAINTKFVTLAIRGYYYF